MVAAYQSAAYTMAEIARFFDVHYMTVSRAVRCGIMMDVLMLELTAISV
jgi:hypothetical protein